MEPASDEDDYEAEGELLELQERLSADASLRQVLRNNTDQFERVSERLGSLEASVAVYLGQGPDLDPHHGSRVCFKIKDNLIAALKRKGYHTNLKNATVCISRVNVYGAHNSYPFPIQMHIGFGDVPLEYVNASVTPFMNKETRGTYVIPPGGVNSKISIYNISEEHDHAVGETGPKFTSMVGVDFNHKDIAVRNAGCIIYHSPYIKSKRPDPFLYVLHMNPTCIDEQIEGVQVSDEQGRDYTSVKFQAKDYASAVEMVNLRIVGPMGETHFPAENLVFGVATGIPLLSIASVNDLREGGKAAVESTLKRLDSEGASLSERSSALFGLSKVSGSYGAVFEFFFDLYNVEELDSI